MSTSDKLSDLSTECLVLPFYKGKKLDGSLKQVDELLKGQIKQVLASGDLEGNLADKLLIHTQHKSIKRVLLIGCDKAKELTISEYRKVLKAACDALKAYHISEASCLLQEVSVAKQDLAWKVREAIIVLHNSYYEFTHCKSEKKVIEVPELAFPVDEEEVDTVDEAVHQGLALSSGFMLSKNLANLPPNICNPTYLANQAEKLAKNCKQVSTEILSEEDMKKLGMGSLLSVSQGSDQPAKLIVMKYQGAAKAKAPIVFVGKGITFDSGGYNLKSSEGMSEMKYDMCGAATLFGLMQTVSELELELNIVSIIAASENLVNGKASRPSDIVTSMSGKTIEILNTDAEGRLVLCDALTYAAKFKPTEVIDVATLTGGAIIALGLETTTLFGNHQGLVDSLIQSGEKAGDAAWQLPMTEEGFSYLYSHHADLANVPAYSNMAAKAMIGACFLARFCEDYRWAHLDIAGVASKSGREKGSTGRPLALLVQYLLDYKVKL